MTTSASTDQPRRTGRTAASGLACCAAALALAALASCGSPVANDDDDADAGLDADVPADAMTDADAASDPDVDFDADDEGGAPPDDLGDVPADAPPELDTDTDETFDAGDVGDLGDGDVDLVEPCPEDAVCVRYDLRARDFFASPWPSDHRVHADGTPDLSTFPSANFGPLPTFRAAIEHVFVGYSTMPVVYVAFESELGDATLPSPRESLDPGSAIQLVDVSEVGCGQRIPVVSAFDPRGDHYRAPNVLSVSPVPGFALRPTTSYALIVLSELTSTIGRPIARPRAFEDALRGEGPPALVAALDRLETCLARDALSIDEVAVATVFTTQDPSSELQRFRDAVVDPARVPAPELVGLAVDAEASAEGVATTWRGTYRTPIFQSGVPPYAVGGAFAYDAAGQPAIQRWEDVPFVLAIPDVEAEGPYPVLVYIDGTGANLRRTLTRQPVTGALQRGFAVASFAPQFHDARAVPGSDPIVHSFNYVNPVSGRTVFRQQVVDTAYFVRVLREAIPAEIAPGSQIDPSTLVYGGHSQGGIVGAFVAGVETEFSGYVLNGTGTYLSVTVTRRTDPVDIPGLIEQMFAVGRPLDVQHPLVALVQLATDVVEPHNYAPAWRGRPGHPAGAHVLVVNGWNDTTTFPPSMDAMAISGGLAPVAPAGWDVDTYAVWDEPSEVEPPIVGNATALDGSPLTLATFLDRDGDHFTVRTNRRVRDAALGFWSDAVVGVPAVR